MYLLYILQIVQVTVIVTIQKTDTRDPYKISWKVPVEITINLEKDPLVGNELNLEEELKKHNQREEDPVEIVSIEDDNGAMLIFTEAVEHCPIIVK
jgi:hypothetical protein